MQIDENGRKRMKISTVLHASLMPFLKTQAKNALQITNPYRRHGQDHIFQPGLVAVLLCPAPAQCLALLCNIAVFKLLPCQNK